MHAWEGIAASSAASASSPARDRFADAEADGGPGLIGQLGGVADPLEIDLAQQAACGMWTTDPWSMVKSRIGQALGLCRSDIIADEAAD